MPGTIVIDDKWQASYGAAEPDAGAWPDLRGWIADRHARGQRVLLWWKAWDPEGIPVEETVRNAAGAAITTDPSNPSYRRRLERTVGALLGPDGLDADGLKLDFTGRGTERRVPRGARARRAWGIALLHDLLQTVYRAAKVARPDALIVAHAPNPVFADVADMVRLNDAAATRRSGRLRAGRAPDAPSRGIAAAARRSCWSTPTTGAPPSGANGVPTWRSRPSSASRRSTTSIGST